MLKDKKGYVMYRSFIDSIRTIDAKDFKECILALSDYAFDGIEYTGDNPMVTMYLTLVKPQIDANNARYENGKKGGRPAKEKVVEEPKELADVEPIELNDGSEWRPTTEQYAEYCRLYPNVNIVQEFRNMRGWCKSNPQKRKTPRGITKFVNGWLQREQDRGNRGHGGTVKIGMPDYITNQLSGAIRERKEATQETLNAVKKLQEGMM